MNATRLLGAAALGALLLLPVAGAAAAEPGPTNDTDPPYERADLGTECIVGGSSGTVTEITERGNSAGFVCTPTDSDDTEQVSTVPKGGVDTGGGPLTSTGNGLATVGGLSAAAIVTGGTAWLARRRFGCNS